MRICKAFDRLITCLSSLKLCLFYGLVYTISKTSKSYEWILKSMFFIYFSAGVGRTGVFITLSIVLERMRYEGVVDMFQTCKMLRTQRPAMVQTEVRLHFSILNYILYSSS